jgi:CDP-diacylglycerol--serine O-phosphatidyltransferase
LLGLATHPLDALLVAEVLDLLEDLGLAAALVAGLVWIVDDNNIDPAGLKWWVFAVTLFAGLTMVSNVPYWSFKSINLKKSVPFLAIFVFVIALALLSYQPPLVLFAGFVAYAVSGYFYLAWTKLRRRPPAPPAPS